VVAGAQSCFTFLAAGRESAASCHPTFTTLLPHRPKTRVGGFFGGPSGRLSRRGRRRSMFTPGSRGCAYKTASGRHEWPNRDPIGDPGFELLRRTEVNVAGAGPNLYDFVGNNPISRLDGSGLCAADCQAQLEKDMAKVAEAGAACAADDFEGQLIGGFGAVAAGGVGAIITTPIGGVVIGGVVLGGAELWDWIAYNHCMSKVNKMREAAQKRYNDCMKANGN
jgi:hypothetical protein